MKKIIAPLAKLMVNRQLKQQGNPLEQFNSIKQSFVLPDTKGECIFIGPIRMSINAHLFEGLLAYHYRARGYKVYGIFCGQTLSNCETIDYNRVVPETKCATCFVQQKKFIETFNIEPLYLHDYISDSESKEIDEIVLKSNFKSKIIYKDVDLTSHVHSGIMRVLKKSHLESSDNTWVKKFTRTALQTYIASQNMMLEKVPKHLILSHGTYSTWGALSEAALRNDIHQIVWGRGYVGKGNIMATHNGSYLFQNNNESNQNFSSIKLTEEQKLKIESYYQAKRNPNNKVDYVNYYKSLKIEENNSSLRNKMQLKNDWPIVGMFPNIPWDGQAFSFSETFPTIRKFIQLSIDFFSTKQAYLIIRAHPAEMHGRSKGQMERFKDILSEVSPTLPENIIFLDADSEISSYQIEKEINAALLYAGTIALEFVMNDTPVIQAGKNAYHNKGFLFEPNNESEFYELLDLAIKNQLNITVEMSENARKYAYHWIYRRHFPETLINFEGQQRFVSYQFNRIEELLANDSFNQFIECIETGNDFIYHHRNLE